MRQSPDLVDSLLHTAESHPLRPATLLVNDANWDREPTVLTYGDLVASARALAVRLREDCAPGSRVLLLFPTGTEFLIGYIGCLFAAVVPVPAPPPGNNRNSLARTVAVIKDADVAMVLTTAADAPDIGAMLHGRGLGRVVVVATDVEPLGDPGAWTPPDIDAHTLALLQYTSGSTSEPRGVMVTHTDLVHNFRAMRDHWGLGPDTRTGCWTPNFHDMGLIAGLLLPLHIGSASVVMSPTDFIKRPHRWLKCVDRFDVAHSVAPNFAYDLCVRRVTDEQAADLDLSRWRFIGTGSEPVDASVLDRFVDRFRAAGVRRERVFAAYGLAEATLFVSATPNGTAPVVVDADPERMSRHELAPAAEGVAGSALVSCGASGHLDIRIVDRESARALPDGRVGEVWLRGPGIARGYWRNDEATRRTFGGVTADGEGGFLRTGDLGVLRDGELIITGRIKDVLMVHGRNLYPQDLEREIRDADEAFARGRGSVFAVPVPREEIVVVQEVAGRDLDGERLGALAGGIRRLLLREFGVPAANVVLVRRGAVRTTTSGKVQRALMRELFVGNALQPLHEELGERTAADYRQGR
ncbi:fatty acyl-AMP ligase [Streptomyces sp. NPDC004539]|uniref:fatty acyl-AMP ligase n=1 Tax=Streptomyces sp. NPDC004539 TaxID=3154280 RepID=UPI0033A1E010